MKELRLETSKGTIPISKLIMGSTYLGTDFDKEKTFAFLDYYFLRGGRTIDTARVYGQKHPREVSESEKVIGEWICARGCRNKITLISKGAHPPLEDFSQSRVTATEILRDIDDSLACLNTDYIDIYFLHRDDANANLVEVMGALTQAVQDGKIRTFGASNWSLERMLEANAVAKENGLLPFTIAQIQWSLAACDAEGWGDDTLVFMTEESYRGFLQAGIPVLAYAAQAKGLFTQYIERGPEGVSPKAMRFLNPTNRKRIERTQELLKQHSGTPAQICLAYLMDNPLPAAAIIGCSTMEQLEDSMGSVGVSLTQAEIEGLVAE